MSLDINQLPIQRLTIVWRGRIGRRRWVPPEITPTWVRRTSRNSGRRDSRFVTGSWRPELMQVHNNSTTYKCPQTSGGAFVISFVQVLVSDFLPHLSPTYLVKSVSDRQLSFKFEVWIRVAGGPIVLCGALDNCPIRGCRQNSANCLITLLVSHEQSGSISKHRR